MAMDTTPVRLTMPDGILPMQVFAPTGKQRKGGLIFYMDAFGLRPELDGMCRRYAEAGYVVFLPDLYYRLGRLRFAVPSAAHEPLDPAMSAANTATTLGMSIADTGAILAHAAATPAYGVARFGTVGYCMGARHALGAAATYSGAIAACACLHGGRLVWDGPDSPHRYILLVAGALYFGFAAVDETCPDAHKDLIESTIAASSVRGQTEHYPAAHGWTFPTRWCYDPIAAERAFERVLALLDAEVAA